MNPRWIAFLKLAAVAATLTALILIFPKALGFVEMAAIEVRYLWWVILLLALGLWLIWGLGSRKKK